MGFGRSLSRAFRSAANVATLGAASGNFGDIESIGRSFGTLSTAGLVDLNRRRQEQGLSPVTQEQITAGNVFSRLSPEQQKDILINNPNIVTALGEQRFDPLTNTLKLTESPFTQAQRERQQQLAEQLSTQLLGQELPETDPSARFEEGRELLEPAFTEQRERLEQQLADQGIPRGSEAFGRELERLERSQGRQLREIARESVATSEAQRAARFNEISSLLGQQQVGGIGFGQFQPSFSGTDVTGFALGQQQLQTQFGIAKKQADAQRRQALIGGLGQVGAAAVPALVAKFSDIRLKENIEKVGVSESGIPIYHFEYINKNLGQFRYEGVMAQDLKEIKPEAVIEYNDGVLAVNYNKIDVEFRRVN
jgi:hypothetical protein